MNRHFQMNEQSPGSLLKFWFEDVKPEEKFNSSPELDTRVRDRFESLWNQAVASELGEWKDSPDGWLALIILLDQFPRNMFRDTGKAFSSDSLALETAREAIDGNIDLESAAERRIFFYLPFMHSEVPADQDSCINLIRTRMGETGANSVLHARAHRRIIRQFGRFPYRNKALGRTSTTEEISWMTDAGYGKVVQDLQNE